MVRDEVIFLAGGWIVSVFKRFFSPSRLIQKNSMITIEKNIVDGNALLTPFALIYFS